MLGFVLLACGVYAFLNPGNNLAFSVVSYATCFFDKAVYHGFFNISRLFEDKKELQDEVAELKEEISTLRDDIVSLNELKRQNEEYAKYFDGIYPARSCFEVAALPKNAKVEIECIAIKK